MTDKKHNNHTNILLIIIAILGFLVLIEGVYLLHLSRKSGQLGEILSKYEATSKKMSEGFRNWVTRAPAAFTPPKVTRYPSMGLPSHLANELERMQAKIDQMLENFNQNQYLPTLAPAPAVPQFALSPDIESQETNDTLTLKFDMPGMDKDKIKVQIENGILTVGGERRIEEKKEDVATGSSFSEVQYGSYSRSVSLPPYLETAKVEASYDKGILSLKFPKKKAAGARSQTVPVA